MLTRPVTSAFVLVLAASSSALAQRAPAPADTTPPPARAGNIYDHKAHQPMESDLPPAARSGSSQSQVEKEVQELLRQTDELDRQSEQRARPAPAPR